MAANLSALLRLVARRRSILFVVEKQAYVSQFSRSSGVGEHRYIVQY